MVARSGASASGKPDRTTTPPSAPIRPILTGNDFTPSFDHGRAERAAQFPRAQWKWLCAGHAAASRRRRDPETEAESERVQGTLFACVMFTAMGKTMSRGPPDSSTPSARETASLFCRIGPSHPAHSGLVEVRPHGHALTFFCYHIGLLSVSTAQSKMRPERAL